MPDNTQDDVYSEFIDEIIVRWDRSRKGGDVARADAYIRKWLFNDLPEKTAQAIPNATVEFIALEHAKTMFAVLAELDRRGRTAESFSLLTWTGEKYARHPTSVAWSVITAVVEYCESRAHTDGAHSEGSVKALRALINAVGRPADIYIERALADAMEKLYHIFSYWSQNPHEQAAEFTALTSETVDRWQYNKDSTLRSKAALALLNRALFTLQDGREDYARHDFAKIIDRFGGEPPGVNTDVDKSVCIARKAFAILDQTKIPGPDFNLKYFRAQQDYWSARRQNSDHNESRWQQLTKAARDKHEKSAGRLRAHLCTGEPIVLFLRSFILTEQSGNLPSGSSLIWDRTPESTSHFYRSIHPHKSDKIMTELSSKVTLVGAASTIAGEFEMQSELGIFVPDIRLHLPSDGWFEIICRLISVASKIIVRAAKINRGLAMEMAALSAANRMNDTVIIIEEESDHFPWNRMLNWDEGEPLTKDHPLLASFPCVLSGADLSSKGIDGCPEIVRLLAQLKAISNEPLEGRLTKTISSLESATIPAIDF